MGPMNPFMVLDRGNPAPAPLVVVTLHHPTKGSVLVDQRQIAEFECAGYRVAAPSAGARKKG